MGRVAVVLLLALSTGCVHQRGSLPKGPVIFRNCVVIDRTPDGQALTCKCMKVVPKVDAKTGKTVLLCVD